MEYSENNIRELASGIKISQGEISEILGNPPRSVYLYSNMGIALVIFIIILSSLFIPYRQTLPFKAVIMQYDSVHKKDEVKDSLVVKGFAPVGNAGVIKINQEVHILLDAYPAAEFGILKGTVSEIKPFTSKQEVEFSISVKQETGSSSKMQVPHQPLLTGTGSVIIRETNYFSRIFYTK